MLFSNTIKPLSDAFFDLGALRNVTIDQSDHMATLFLQYLALYNTELLPNTIKSCQTRLTVLPKIK